MASEVTAAVDRLRAECKEPVDVAVIAGSGLSTLAESLGHAVSIPYGNVPGWPMSTVDGHAGRLVLGSMFGRRVAVAAGRAHMYEGYSAREVTFPVRVLHALGARTLVVTNASGGLSPDYRPGDLVVIADHIFLPGMTGHNPLVGPNDDDVGPRFPSVSQAYDQALRGVALRSARSAGFTVHAGVYAMVGGPSYETPAEGRFLRTLGADVVGMSTAPEVIVARHAQMRVVGLSLVTNVVDVTGPDEGATRSDGQQAEPTPRGSDADDLHAEVTAVGRQQSQRLARVIEDVVRSLQA